MTKPERKPWICIEGDIAKDPVMEKLFKHLDARLYLFYFKKSGKAYWPIKEAADQWKIMRTSLEARGSYPPAPPPVVVELCAATHGCKTGGDNWTACDNTTSSLRPFPDTDFPQHPYALWVLAVGTKLAVVSNTSDHLWKLNDDNKIVTTGTGSAEDEEEETEYQEASDTNSPDDLNTESSEDTPDRRTGISTVSDNTVLPLALALKWLLEHRPCATKAAIESSGLIQELCKDKPAAPASAATPATTLGTS